MTRNMPKPRAMVYSANLDGHRQVFCDVFTDIFLELGYQVLLVVGLGGDVVQNPWKYIQHYRGHPDVVILDPWRLSSARTEGRLPVGDLVRLQMDHAVQVSLFCCGDELRDELKSIADGQAPRLHGHNIGVFNGTDHWVGIESLLAPGLSLRQRLRAVRDRIGPLNRERRFYEQDLAAKGVLDAILVQDERVAEAKGYPFIWLPDIFRPFAWQEDGEAEAEYAEVVPAYERFLRCQQNRHILLYFSIARRYKGYDTLLKLAEQDEETCFVHCGFDDGKDHFDVDVQSIREKLRAQGRFFEVGRQVWGWRTVDAFFDSTQRLVSTTRVYGSSGTILQAWDRGKPVLLPDRGLLRHRTRKYGLGKVYHPGSAADLLLRWLQFKRESSARYASSLAVYMQNYRRERVVDAVLSAVRHVRTGVRG